MEGVVRDKEESRALYEILQDQVIPLYYNYGKLGLFAWMGKNGQALDDVAAALF